MESNDEYLIKLNDCLGELIGITDKIIGRIEDIENKIMELFEAANGHERIFTNLQERKMNDEL